MKQIMRAGILTILTVMIMAGCSIEPGKIGNAKVRIKNTSDYPLSSVKFSGENLLSSPLARNAEVEVEVEGVEDDKSAAFCIYYQSDSYYSRTITKKMDLEKIVSLYVGNPQGQIKIENKTGELIGAYSVSNEKAQNSYDYNWDFVILSDGTSTLCSQEMNKTYYVYLMKGDQPIGPKSVYVEYGKTKTVTFY